MQRKHVSVKYSDWSVTQRTGGLTVEQQHIDTIAKALDAARQLAEKASDWNLDEVEIDGEMVDTLALAQDFQSAIDRLAECRASTPPLTNELLAMIGELLQLTHLPERNWGDEDTALRDRIEQRHDELAHQPAANDNTTKGSQL